MNADAAESDDRFEDPDPHWRQPPRIYLRHTTGPNGQLVTWRLLSGNGRELGCAERAAASPTHATRQIATLRAAIRRGTSVIDLSYINTGQWHWQVSTRRAGARSRLYWRPRDAERALARFLTHFPTAVIVTAHRPESARLTPRRMRPLSIVNGPLLPSPRDRPTESTETRSDHAEDPAVRASEATGTVHLSGEAVDGWPG